MGLGSIESKEDDYEKESKELLREGLTIRSSSVDDYFYDTESGSKAKKLKVVEDAVRGVLKVTTEGFENGELVHNMPCPVCLKTQAKYINDGKEHFFGPCESCASKGYVLKRSWWGL